jgi:flagellar biogenesis protein FliO
MSRSLSLTSALLAAALLPASAHGGPSVPVSVEDRGGEVAVLLTGARTSAARPQNRGDRLELPLDEAPPAVELKLEDATVRKVELRSSPPSLRIQLRHGSESTRLAADMAVLRQYGGVLEIVLPREPRQAAAARATAGQPIAAASTQGATQAATAPSTSAPATQPASSAIAPARPIASVQPIAPVHPASSSASANPAPVAPVPSAVAPDAAAAAVPGAPSQALPVARPELDGTGARASGSPVGTTLGFAALAALGAVGWLWHRRKRTGRALSSPLEILAQVSVGPRARVVWLSAGRREMLISVSEKDVRVLGQWVSDRNGEPAAAFSPPPPSVDEPVERRRMARPSSRLRTNPSLSGLLRLRDQHAADVEPPNGDNGAADGDANEPDAEWARQLVAATRRGALR